VVVFVVQNVNGNPRRRAVGSVVHANIPKTFSAAAARRGIPSNPAAAARVAAINGTGPPVSAAPSGHCMKIGTRGMNRRCPFDWFEALEDNALYDRPADPAVFGGQQNVDKLGRLADIAADSDLNGGSRLRIWDNQHLSPPGAAHLIVQLPGQQKWSLPAPNAIYRDRMINNIQYTVSEPRNAARVRDSGLIGRIRELVAEQLLRPRECPTSENHGSAHLGES